MGHRVRSTAGGLGRQDQFLTILDSRTSRVLITAFLFAVGFGFVYAARRTLILFLFAIFFAYLINPAVLRLEKLVRGRGRAIAVIYLLLLIGLAAFALASDFWYWPIASFRGSAAIQSL